MIVISLKSNFISSNIKGTTKYAYRTGTWEQIVNVVGSLFKLNACNYVIAICSSHKIPFALYSLLLGF